MKICMCFNLVLLVVFLLGFILSVWVIYELLIENVKLEVLVDVGLIMEMVMLVCSYIIDEIKLYMDVE